MAIIPDDNEFTLGFKAGVDNIAGDTALPEDAVRSMINLDLVSGRPTLREGRAVRYAGTHMHSLWSHPMAGFGLFMHDTTLKQLHESLAVTDVLAGLEPRDRSYEFINHRVYHSNGVDTGTVSLLGEPGPWGVECPRDTYVLSASDGGGLPAGEYSVALTFLMGREEGGAFEPQTIVLTEGQGITIDQLPAPLSTDVTAMRVYASPADDPRLFHVRDVAIGMVSVTIGAGGRGRRLDTVGLEPAPPGRYLLAKNSRIFSAQGRVLQWTESLRYGLHDPVNNRLPMPENITGIGSPADGSLTLYIGGLTKTFMWQGNDVDDAKLTGVMHNGIVPGSLIHVDADSLAIDSITMRSPVWMGTNGMFYVGTPQSRMLLNKGAAATIYQKAAAAYFEQEGRSRLIVAGQGGRKADLAITDRVVARVVS